MKNETNTYCCEAGTTRGGVQVSIHCQAVIVVADGAGLAALPENALGWPVARVGHVLCPRCNDELSSDDGLGDEPQEREVRA